MSDGRRDSEGNLMLGSYWFKLEPTGEEVVDVILSRIAGAGKGSHSTETWDDSDDGEPSHVDLIQSAARSAATEIASLRARLEEAENSNGFEAAMRHAAKILPNAGIAAIIEEWDSNAPDAALEESRRG